MKDVKNPHEKADNELEPFEDETMINREFFKGHKSPIIFLCHIENGKDFLSIDETGHLIVWTYSEEYIMIDGYIRPSHKYRIPMEYTKFERVKSQESKNAKVTDIDEAHISALDFRQ